MAAGGMNASPMSPNTSGYSGPTPTFGGVPFLNPTGGGTPPSMTATPPTNPTPAPPQPQMQPAVMPPYGGPQRGPGSSFGGDMDSFGPRGGYGNLPPDRMPQRDMFDRGPFGRREQQPGGPTWSQQGGIYNYDPNGPQQGGFNPFGNAPARPNAVPGQFRQMMQERLQQMRAQPPAAGLGAINPYNQAPTQRAVGQQVSTTPGLQRQQLDPAYGPQASISPEELARLQAVMAQNNNPLATSSSYGDRLKGLMMPQNSAYGQQLSGQSVAPQVSGGQASQSAALEQAYQDFLRQQQPYQ